ncbi:MAG TPA: cytochrome c [Povalibacter sp.]|uniref:cytochrome c n=1 Tax=Povalibacter sp. TaxID=1962978 RepID=UPI002B72D7F0|nr:cytochrome c [Povalibacter sp.]HMN46759.1 cytochrome c [Povalibacter sp.]
MSPPARRLAAAAAVIVLCTGVIGAGLLRPGPAASPPDIATLDASPERGAYLATASNCRTCHTTNDGQPFAGGVRFQTPFGVLYSTNVTMDEATGIGRWSFEDFYASMKHGVRPDGTQLYPAFPYPSFAKLTDADIASLYLYMKTVEPVNAPARENELDFPYNLRSGLRAWNRLFHDPGAFVADPARSPEWNRGAYLVQGPVHCGACHSPRNFLGAEREELALTGGTFIDRVSEGKYRQWSAVNLTSAKRGLAAWSLDEIVAYLKDGESARAVVHGPMTEVVMNSTRHLEDTDVRAIATYLKELPALDASSGKNADHEQLAAGEVAYTVHCGTCHLPTGLGDEVMGVTLAGNAIVQANDPASLINVVLYGPHLPPPPFVSDRTRMKPFGKRLSDEDIANLTTYLRASFGNDAGVVTAAQVKRQR